MLLTGRTDFDGVADNSYIGRHALNTSTDWQAFTGGFIDDAGVSRICYNNEAPSSKDWQWVVLALWKMSDYKKIRGEANVDTFLVTRNFRVGTSGLIASQISAGQLYDKIAANWDDTCGGGGTLHILSYSHSEPTNCSCEVWWTTEHGYKNAITNELFLTLSARGNQTRYKIPHPFN
jgi:hypothetical protein